MSETPVIRIAPTPVAAALRQVADELREGARRSIAQDGERARRCRARAAGMNAQERRLLKRRGHAAATVLSVAAQLERRAERFDWPRLEMAGAATTTPTKGTYS